MTNIEVNVLFLLMGENGSQGYNEGICGLEFEAGTHIQIDDFNKAVREVGTRLLGYSVAVSDRVLWVYREKSYFGNEAEMDRVRILVESCRERATFRFNRILTDDDFRT